MEKITRRDFLKGSMAGAATMALSGIVTVPAVMAEEEDKYQVKDWKAFMTVNKEMTVFCQEEIPKIGKKIPYFR
ncbi:MAG: twin-arginine translocation signal domain-containing protein, partial [Clostridiales bacterium]|nr:twin-arginine translocation signal domain-containing protein [Clostridiales bacterium]